MSGLVLNAAALVCLFLTFMSDPGIVQNQSKETLSKWEQSVKAQVQPLLKVQECCATCETTFPFTDHDANKCVFKYDHTCTWIGNDIGVSNRGLFLLYLAFQLTSSVHMFWTRGVLVLRQESEFVGEQVL